MQWERAEMLVEQQYHCEMQAMGVVLTTLGNTGSVGGRVGLQVECNLWICLV
jgi:hypothetical protein